MKRMLINATQPEERRIAYVEGDNKLYNLIIQRVGSEDKSGNIYKGRVSSIAPNLDAIFVDYGGERHGFLPFKEVTEAYYLEPWDPHSNTPPDLNKLMKVGQELIVRVVKDERGNKGAALSTFISLAGAYLVLMPNNPRAGISRRIEGENRDEIRDRLNQLTIPEDMGVIVRTAGIDRTVSELQWDLDVLIKHFQSIKDAAAERPAPFLIHQENNPVMQAIRDNLMDIGEIIIDDEATFEKAKQYISQIRPDYEDKIKQYSEKVALFTKFQLEHQIETAFKRTVQLPSGGTIVFDQTEGGMMIDVNSAGTKDSNLEKTAFKTNQEAAEEIARQLRLRDIGGLVVIDFIDMTSIRNQREIESIVLNAVKLDRARVHISRISRFGLLEMSRQRERKSLKEVSQHVCPTCNGHGTVRSIETICLSIMRLISEEILKPKTAEIHVQVSTEVATYILNEKRSALHLFETENDIRVLVIPNPNLQNENFDIKRIREGDKSSHSQSYKRLKSADTKGDIAQLAADTKAPEAPAVEQVYPQRPEDNASNGLIKKLWSTMFGVPEEEEQAQPERRKPYEHKQARDKKTQSGQARQQRRPRQQKQTTSTISNGQKSVSRRSNQRTSPNRRSQSTSVASTPTQRQSKSSNGLQEQAKAPAKQSSNPQPRKPKREMPVTDDSQPVVIRAYDSDDKQSNSKSDKAKTETSTTKKEDIVE